MKSQLSFALTILILAANAHAQDAIVDYTASAANRPVTYSTDGFTFFKFPTGNPASIASYGNLNVTAYSAPNGTQLTLSQGVPDFSNWKIATSAPDQQVAIIPGGMPGYAVILDPSEGAGGATEEFEIVGWTGNSQTFAQAVQAWENGTALLGWSGSSASGGALGWSQITGMDLMPSVMVVGTNGFNGLALTPPIPEPGSVALAALGAVALFVFRWRKKISG